MNDEIQLPPADLAEPSAGLGLALPTEAATADAAPMSPTKGRRKSKPRAQPGPPAPDWAADSAPPPELDPNELPPVDDPVVESPGTHTPGGSPRSFSDATVRLADAERIDREARALAREQEYEALMDRMYRKGADRLRYWVGLYPDTPRAHVSVGNGIEGESITVHASTFRPTPTTTIDSEAPVRQRGGFVHFTTDGLEEFKHNLRTLIVRFDGDPATALTRAVVNAKILEGHMYRTPDGQIRQKSPYRYEPGDHPMACYVFAVPESEVRNFLDGRLPPRLMAFPPGVGPLVAACHKRIREIESQSVQSHTMPVPDMLMSQLSAPALEFPALDLPPG